jgi:hypothetical protein
MSKHFVTLVIIAMLSIKSLYAQTCPPNDTYTYITKNGAGSTPDSWSQAGDWAAPGRPPYTLVSNTYTIPSGDIVEIASSNFYLTANLVVEGALVVTGKLNMAAGTYIEVKPGGVVCCNDGGGSCNLSDRINIGGTQVWSGNDGTVVGPAYSDGTYPLPIELLSFKASKGITNVKLSWATASELNFHYFEVERSTDGVNFSAIGRITGNGTTNVRQDYSFEDEKPLIGKNYYQLKAVDFDGYTERFQVVMVDYDGKKSFSVYPNPSDGLTLHTETNFVPIKNSFVAIYTSTGAEVGRYIIESDVAELTMPVPLQSGWYYAKFISSEYTSVARILVK